MKYVKWLEPGENDEPVVNMIPVAEAIALSKRYGFYENDLEALAEFISINCADLVDVEDDQITKANE
ncbi:hypothetical protein [Nitrosomonas nitrosa]|uniref:hypothetical protein n=1 Tax=Nitrosomonas nitrosa TaxID=52442 RepID=UPI0023F7EECC|nr:hypothetical protein [Nitrosomonas nitrosa]MCO6434514.1 hypothetical protein [Nitrosomonas nitrosa]